MSRLTASSLKTSMRLAMIGPRTLLGSDSPQKLWEDLHQATADELLETLGRLKGAAMKVGQLASFIDAGCFPPEVRDIYQDALGSLRDAAPPMKGELVRDVIREELGGEPASVFGAWNTRPAAAASLGQVHFARLDDGRDVAVKIQYPGIEDAVRSDLAMAQAVKPLMPLLAPGLEVGPALEEIRTRALQECDYHREARNLATLADHYEDHPFAWVPRPIPELSTKRVLTMERARGLPFSRMKKLPRSERDRLGEILFRFYWGSLQRNGFTSADPHPGNYLLMEDGRIAFLDFGLACELDPLLAPNQLGAFLALRDRDPERLFQHTVSMGYLTRPDKIDAQRLLEYVAFSLAPLADDAEYTFRREFIAERTAAMLDPRNEWWRFIRQLNLPRWAVLVYRLELGLFAVLAQLRATANWHRITMEFYGEGEPSTEMGQLEAKWLEARRA
ncbi:MAG TPA: AarF/ABC1/UbiB kinase family protein [Actinomycetota bacterium]|nr:AarF/ABC1/UbiB kinase family protein [Actinomycetota bacterium]